MKEHKRKHLNRYKKSWGGLGELHKAAVSVGHKAIPFKKWEQDWEERKSKAKPHYHRNNEWWGKSKMPSWRSRMDDWEREYSDEGKRKYIEERRTRG